MQDPLHGTINKLTLAAASAAGASATLDATDGGGDAGASTGGMRRPYIAPGMSDPMGELPVLNAKYITNCEELHLSGKDIRKLAHFGRSEQSGFVSPGFVNLNVLWLNNNVLRKIENLDDQIRMFELYVFNNQITTLEGSLQKMRFLKKLLLHNNKLKDLDVQLEYLARLPFLEELTLFGNSIAEERGYRLKVICRCPSVKVLDRHAVTDAERFEANVLFAESSTSDNVQPPSNLCSQQADAFRQNIAFGMKKPGLGRGPDNPASAAASIHLTLEVGRPWQSPMWNPAPWKPIYDPEGMSENEKDLIGRVKRIHRDERRLEKQQKLVERETIWMEKMDALLQLARSALARARNHDGETAEAAVEMALQRVADLELTQAQLQRYMDGWRGECTVRKDPMGGFGVHVDGGEGRPEEDSGVVIGVEGAAAAAGLLKCVRVVSVNGKPTNGKAEIDGQIAEADAIGVVVLGLEAVKPKDSQHKWSKTNTGVDKKLSGVKPDGWPPGGSWDGNLAGGEPDGENELQVWPLPDRLDYEAARDPGPAPWERPPKWSEDGGESDNNRLRQSVFGERFAKPGDAEAGEGGEEGEGEGEGAGGSALDDSPPEELYEMAQAALVPGGWDEIAEQGGGWKERASAAAAKLEGADREEAFRLARLALRADTQQAVEQPEADAEPSLALDATASSRRSTRSTSFEPGTSGFRSTTQLRRSLVM